MMLVEARVFRSDDGVLEIERDLAQRNEFVPFVIRRVVNPGLEAALHVHCGGWRIDPLRSHKHQHSQRPQKRECDEKPSNEQPKGASPTRRRLLCDEKRGLELRGWIFGHISE